MVSTVPTASPNIMVSAMETQKASWISGMTPSTVVAAPSTTGRTRESPADVARNLSRWVDCLMARTFSHALVTQLADEGTIPVINGLTDLLHPCQAMADLQSMAEWVEPKDIVLAWVGDGNNVANSLMLLAAVLGFEIRLATPESHRPALRVRQLESEQRILRGELRRRPVLLLGRVFALHERQDPGAALMGCGDAWGERHGAVGVAQGRRQVSPLAGDLREVQVRLEAIRAQLERAREQAPCSLRVAQLP